MPPQLHRKGRKRRTASSRTFHSSWARSLLEQVAGCWLRFVRSTVRDVLGRCGSSLLWPHRSRRLDWSYFAATFAFQKPGGRIEIDRVAAACLPGLRRIATKCRSTTAGIIAVRPLDVHSWFSRCLKQVAPGQFSACLRIQLKEMDVTPLRPAGKLFPKA